MKPPLGFAATTIMCIAGISSLAGAQESQTRPELLGIHIGQPEDEVRRTLQGRATFEKEEEGQQVWRVLKDASVQYVIVGFDRENQIRYVTALASSSGAPMACPPLGDANTAAKAGSAENMEWRRELKYPGQELTIIARGASPDHLASCSIKKQGAGIEQEEEEQEQRQKEKHP